MEVNFITTGEESLAGSDEQIKELEERAKCILVDIIEKGCLNFIDIANILSQITIDTALLSKNKDRGCVDDCRGGCNVNCVNGCACR